MIKEGEPPRHCNNGVSDDESKDDCVGFENGWSQKIRGVCICLSMGGCVLLEGPVPVIGKG